MTLQRTNTTAIIIHDNGSDDLLDVIIAPGELQNEEEAMDHVIEACRLNNTPVEDVWIEISKAPYHEVTP